MKIDFIPIRTRVVVPPQDDISDIIDSLEVRDGDIVFITSKILSIWQGHTVYADGVEKKDLIRREADYYLPYENEAHSFHSNLTITNNILISSAGIDASNANGYYILWPEEPDKVCRQIRDTLMKKYHLGRLGVVATDSHTTPLRWGVTGMTIGFAGVEPLRDIRGEDDLFGRPIRVTKVNLLDPLAAMAVLLMGESNECTPVVILRDYKGIKFSEECSMEDYRVEPELDIYAPLLSVIPKVK